jgi:RNA polymerase sigma-70 factor, ECF subfamily
MIVKIEDDDRKLVARMLAGEKLAFDAFFSAYAPRLTAFVARRANLNAAAIEDIVQSTLVKAVRHLGSFRGEAALFTWVCEISRNELARLHRSAARQPVHQSLDASPAVRNEVLELRAPADREPPNALEVEAHRGAVASTLEILPHRYACVLEWKYGDGFSVQEIGRMLGLTTIAAQSLLARARKEFRRRWLKEQCQ